MVVHKFHAGELLAQELAGVRQRVAENGLEDFVRQAMPVQHQLFFATQPILYVGSVGPDRRIWASAVVGRPGFVSAPDAESLVMAPLRVVHGDPLAEHLAAGSRLGMLGMEAHTRRRNRLNAHVTRVERLDGEAGGAAPLEVTLGVDLSFGNCPKYIQARHFKFDWDRLERRVGLPVKGRVEGGARLGPEQRRLVRAADTFFLATGFDAEQAQSKGRVPAASVGCDVSHRGGAPGFVLVEDAADDGSKANGADKAHVLKWADFQGNNMFQSIGNLLLNKRAGLLFIDYATGGTLQLTGTCGVDYKDTSLPGALRVMRFEVERWIHTPGALPMTQEGLSELSPYNPPAPVPTTREADDEPQQAKRRVPGPDSDQQPQQQSAVAIPVATPAAATPALTPLRCLSIHDAANGIKTFEFELPPATSPGEPYQPGQYAAFEFSPELLNTDGTAAGTAPSAQRAAAVQRTWTVSSHPGGGASSLPAGQTFTITVKRAGRVSGWLHDRLRVGDRLLFRGFGGEFTPALLGPAFSSITNASGAAPAAPPGVLLLAGGIGITPMRPILEEVVARAVAAARLAAAAAGDEQRQPMVVALGLWVQHADQAALTRELHDAAERAAGGAGVDVRLVLLTTQQPDGNAGAGGLVLGPRWHRAIGRLSTEVLRREVLPLSAGADLSGWHAYVCGPGGFMLAAEGALEQAGVDPALVHTESFDY